MQAMFMEPVSDDYSTESVERVLFVCPEPQVAQVGSQIRYLFEFTNHQKKIMKDYTVC